MKLENVSLTSQGFMEIRGETRWINSTIYHTQDNHGDNISLYSTLSIINSELLLTISYQTIWKTNQGGTKQIRRVWNGSGMTLGRSGDDCGTILR